MNVIGRKVKQIREERQPKLTQEDLAIRLQLLGWGDCSRFTVSKIELRTRKVTDHEVKMLAEALGVSPNCLFGVKE
ncbi:MAG: helix-turn-helix transcriptional regulator [Chloroflexota bacterium]